MIEKDLENFSGKPVTFFMDDASIHKSELMKAHFTRHHNVLFNAPSFPQLNPIELAFSLIKRRVREEHPENVKVLIECIFNACKSINYIQSRNLIRHNLKFLRYALNNEDII